MTRGELMHRSTPKSTLLAALLLLTVLPTNRAFAFELEGVEFSKSQTLAGKTVTLNGAALYEVSFMKIDIYVGALYLPEPTKSWKKVVDPSVPKRVVQHYVVDGSKERITQGWKDLFEQLDPTRAKRHQREIEAFASLFPSVEDGQRLVIDYVPSVGVTVTVGERKRSSKVSAEFSRLLFEAWVGPKADESLRKGYLAGGV